MFGWHESWSWSGREPWEVQMFLALRCVHMAKSGMMYCKHCPCYSRFVLGKSTCLLVEVQSSFWLVKSQSLMCFLCVCSSNMGKSMNIAMFHRTHRHPPPMVFHPPGWIRVEQPGLGKSTTVQSQIPSCEGRPEQAVLYLLEHARNVTWPWKNEDVAGVWHKTW